METIFSGHCSDWDEFLAKSRLDAKCPDGLLKLNSTVLPHGVFAYGYGEDKDGIFSLNIASHIEPSYPSKFTRSSASYMDVITDLMAGVLDPLMTSFGIGCRNIEPPDHQSQNPDLWKRSFAMAKGLAGVHATADIVFAVYIEEGSYDGYSKDLQVTYADARLAGLHYLALARKLRPENAPPLRDADPYPALGWTLAASELPRSLQAFL